jgi:DNA (cytosine-5)-methyltransferase 1
MVINLKMKPKRKFTAIDLFSGCGGLSLGLKRAGFIVTAAVEVDPLAAQTYRSNHKGTILIQSDIRNVTGRKMREAAGLTVGKLDLLAGCPPCQGFSRIRRHGEQDPRNDLLFEFLRIARALRPKVVLLENVPGMTRDRRFFLFVERLESYGYCCKWGVLDAADFNVPQRRRRLIVIGSRVGTIDLPCKKARQRKQTVKEYIGELKTPVGSKDRLHRMYLNCTPRIKKLIANIPIDGGSRISLGKKNQLACHKKTDGFRDVYGRMKWDDVSPTLTGGCFNPSKGRFLHPKQNRPITMREAAILQTFPRSYRFPIESGSSNIARLIGDALPPVFAQRQAEHLVRHLISESHAGNTSRG